MNQIIAITISILVGCCVFFGGIIWGTTAYNLKYTDRYFALATHCVDGGGTWFPNGDGICIGKSK